VNSRFTTQTPDPERCILSHSGGLGSTSGIQTLIAFQHQPLSAGSWVPVVECDFWHWHVCGCLKLIILCVHHARSINRYGWGARRPGQTQRRTSAAEAHAQRVTLHGANLPMLQQRSVMRAEKLDIMSRWRGQGSVKGSVLRH